jgi:ABC-type sulfate transport system substrate-binding protein
MRNWILKLVCALFVAGLPWPARPASAAEVKLLNVSYDVTRETEAAHDGII